METFTCNSSFVGHLKGAELLRQRYDEASSKASRSRTPLHPLQQKSTMNSTPTSSSNITNASRMSQHNSLEHSALRSAPNTFIPSKLPAIADRGGDGGSAALSSTGCSKETSSEQQNCHSKSRKLAINCLDATASTSNHLKKRLHGQNSKLGIDQSPQPNHTSNIAAGCSIKPLTAAAVTMTTEVTEIDLTKEESTEVTPERVTLSSGSTTKRRLKLEDSTSSRPQTKRRRRDSSGSSGKKSVAMLGRTLKKENSGQRTMQSYFQPV